MASFFEPPDIAGTVRKLNDELQKVTRRLAGKPPSETRPAIREAFRRAGVTPDEGDIRKIAKEIEEA